MTMRGHARPDDEPGWPAKLDGQSMAYQLTSLGISVLAFEYLLATTQAELSWLRSFADSMRSGGPQRRLTVSGNTVRSQGEVGI
jgi:hypothetical protein